MVLDLVSAEQARGYRAKLDAASAGRAARRRGWPPGFRPPSKPDTDAATQIMQSLVGYLDVAGYREMFAAAGLDEAVRLAREGAGRDTLLAALPREAADHIGLIGDLDAVNVRLQAYATAGLDEIVLVPATAGDPGGGERTLTALAPQVTELNRL